MRYLVMDAIGKKIEVEASTPRQAREKARRQQAFVGDVQVWERLDPMKENRAGTQEFFGVRPPIIL